MNRCKKAEILIVDDDLEFNAAVTKILEKEGYHIESVSNGQEACVLLDKLKFDLIITDLSMPKKDGMALIEDISNKAKETSVIVITAFGDWDTYAEAVGKGVYAYLDKPVKREKILETVKSALSNKKRL